MVEFGVRFEHGALILSMREAGHTLQQIADVVGVSRERIRQILRDYYPEVCPRGVSEESVAELLGCSSSVLYRLRKEGLINPGRFGSLFRYSADDVEKARSLLNKRLCLACGVKPATIKYCPACTAERKRYGYPFLSPEGKKRHNAQTVAWRKRNPDQAKVIDERAKLKYNSKKKAEKAVLYD
uniref:Putative DNA binding, helix-turn-helix domain containing protein n=1 Tax=viral metagenome TaxID=1070528 RepID=A0A6M3J9C9_9ZZZZ